MRMTEFALGLLALSATACGGPKALQIGAYNYPGTPAYVCTMTAPTQDAKCVPQPKTDDAMWNQSGTQRIPLPPPVLAQCPTGIQRMLIPDLGAQNPQLIVECAPPAPVAGTAGPASAAEVPTAGPAPSP